MSWVALPVEPACMGKAVGEARRPLISRDSLKTQKGRRWM